MTSSAPTNPLSGVEPWDLVASGYQDVTRKLLEPFSVRAVALLAPKPTDLAVDVAAGPGTTSLLLSPRVRRVDALDFSTAMLAEFAKNIDEREIDNVVAIQGDGQALPYETGAYQVGVSMFGLMFFPDRARGFRELRRVLGPGGRAVVSSWAPVDLSPSQQLLFGALRALDPSRPAPQRDVASLENPDVLAASMQSAGFTRVEIHAVTEDMGSASPEAFWRHSARGAAPLVLLRRRVGEEEWKRMEEIAIAHLEKAWDPARALSTTAYLALGYVD